MSLVLGCLVSHALLGLHALMGCDSSCAFKGHNKKAALEAIKSDTTLASALFYLGASFSVPEELFRLCEVIVCKMYGSKRSIRVNDLSYELFASKVTESDNPPRVITHPD